MGFLPIRNHIAIRKHLSNHIVTYRKHLSKGWFLEFNSKEKPVYENCSPSYFFVYFSRNINLDFCMIGEEDQVKHKVSNFEDIGREFNITLRVSPKMYIYYY